MLKSQLLMGKKIALFCTFVSTITGVVALVSNLNFSKGDTLEGKFEYLGSINTAIPIELEISINENEITGFYKYSKYNIPIPVTGTVNGDQITLFATYTSENKKDQFTGIITDGKIQGDWTDYKKHFPFELYLKH